MDEAILEPDLSRWLLPQRPLCLPLVSPSGAPLRPRVAIGDRVHAEHPLTVDPDTGFTVSAPCRGRATGMTRTPMLERETADALVFNCALEKQRLEPHAPAGPQSPQTAADFAALANQLGLVDLSRGWPLARTLASADGVDVGHLVINALDPLPEARWLHRLLQLDRALLSHAIDRLQAVFQPRMTTLAVERSILFSGDETPTLPGTGTVRVEHRYPLAHPRLLATRLFGDRFPYDRPLTSGGVLMIDLQTLFVLSEAVAFGRPFGWRWVFIGGDAVERPGLYRVFIGTEIGDVAESVGFQDGPAVVVHGGLLNGRTLHTPEYVVTAATSAIHFLTPASARRPQPTACVRCGWCSQTCPVNLDPRAIYDEMEYGRPKRAARLHPGACVECGLCSYICPSELDLAAAVRSARRFALTANGDGKKRRRA